MTTALLPKVAGTYQEEIIEGTDTVRQSQEYHLNNPYWKTFDPYVLPLLSQPMDLRRLNELVDDNSEPVRVEKDDSVWTAVAGHQSRRSVQGNY